MARLLKNDSILYSMATGQAKFAIDNSASKGFSKWVNKDIREAALTGDWSALMAKAELQTKRFRREFYK
jgi:hypothetical protein